MYPHANSTTRPDQKYEDWETGSCSGKKGKETVIVAEKTGKVHGQYPAKLHQ